ncbi:TrmH family RNA methyltransferase [Flavobacterium arcticum]|uniref:tRNA (guanosine(18)-2'-O)-methyltransferase n=1 Tax=Flavobacterium arcticum TaxID=1784713 RepID=A0A345HDH8_9FLAO|nr:RNA methyltransferase [Flavobacterium arcticum]AXG74638.1 TrmH family RNA methyltransferase [Flavobacterium arcticum]KAF2512235.1 RNA methyltransferase [Flavobacterium arcticum]
MKNTFDIDYLTYIESFITEDRQQRFLDVLKNRTKHFTVAIEDVFQLHNTSAVMRTCEVFGIQELNVIEERFGKDIDKEIAMGAQKWVDVNRFNSTAACINNLKERGYKIIATSPHESSSPLDTFDITEPAALFFGTEKSGLSDEVIKAADGFVHIPMAGFTESLNISNSAAIIIQDIANRLRQSDIKWNLSEKEIIDKRIDWTRKTVKDIDFITQKYLEGVV